MSPVVIRLLITAASAAAYTISREATRDAFYSAKNKVAERKAKKKGIPYEKSYERRKLYG